MGEKDPLLARLLTAATAGAAPAGPANKRKVIRILLDPDARPVAKGKLCAQEHGFNLHAATKVAANDKAGRVTLHPAPTPRQRQAEDQRKLDYVEEERRILREQLDAVTGGNKVVLTAEQRRRLASTGKLFIPFYRNIGALRADKRIEPLVV